MKGITKTIKNEKKEEKGGFLSMLLGTFGATLLEKMLTEKGTGRAGYGYKDLRSKKMVLQDLVMEIKKN